MCLGVTRAIVSDVGLLLQTGRSLISCPGKVKPPTPTVVPLLAMATLLIPAAEARRPAPPPIRGSWRPLIMELLRRAAPGVPPGGGQGRTALGVLGLLLMPMRFPKDTLSPPFGGLAELWESLCAPACCSLKETRGLTTGWASDVEGTSSDSTWIAAGLDLAGREPV